MLKGNGGLRQQARARAHEQVPPTEKKEALWIRPHDAPLRVQAGGKKLRPYAPRRMRAPKTYLLIGFNLVGVAIVLASAWMLLANFTRSGSAPVSETSVSRTPESAVCTNIQHCATKTTGKTPTHGASPQSSPTTKPTVGKTSTPNPTLSSTSLSVVPQSLTISRSSVCSIGALTPLTLVNQGSSLLIWSQDIAGTSPGLTITDPGRTYRIPPGQTASGSIRCRGSLPTGQYKLGIDFNGGVAHIVVVVTA